MDMPTRLAALKAEAAPEIRRDWRRLAAMYGDTRTPDRLLIHYLLERKLAEGLRQSTKQQRENGLYQTMYDSLIGDLEDHPRRTSQKGLDPAHASAFIERQANMILREIGAEDVFLELGGGDCRVALAVAPHVAKSIVVDVSDALVPADPGVANFQFVKTRGTNIALPDNSVSFIYSNQVMEHLHPDDAVEQLRELLRVLKPGGRYLCRTPSRVSGPHDISMYFEPVANGAHLQEYTYCSLDKLFREAGFGRTRFIVAPRAHLLMSLPRFAAIGIEQFLDLAPQSLRVRICRNPIARALLGVTMIAEKPH
jgi:SAM-dependent methyltransferase